MSAKKQVSKQDILDAAQQVFYRSGMDGLSVRAIAAEAGCSTQPVYLCFSGMEELRQALAEHFLAQYENYLKKEAEKGEYPPYKAYGMAYIGFAKAEPAIFRFLFMRERQENEQNDEIPQSTRQAIAMASEQLWLSWEDAARFHTEIWIFVHGIASMLATSYLDWDMRQVSEMISDAYMGLKARWAEKGAR